MLKGPMDFLASLVALIRDPGPIIEWGGYPALATIVFLETGALVFFLPGDSLLVVAGFYASKGALNILYLNALLGPLAVLGDAVSYTIGSQLGPSLFNRPEGKFLKPAHLRAAQAFYEKHGGKAIFLARFVPVVRTFVPVIAGAARMPYARFAMFNVTGGLAWVSSMTLTGYFLAERFPYLKDHLEKVIVVVILISVLPALFEYWRARTNKGETLSCLL